jgi:hypothetical protein
LSREPSRAAKQAVLEARPAQPVDRAVAPDQGGALAVSDEGVILDRAGHRARAELRPASPNNAPEEGAVPAYAVLPAPGGSLGLSDGRHATSIALSQLSQFANCLRQVARTAPTERCCLRQVNYALTCGWTLSSPNSSFSTGLSGTRHCSGSSEEKILGEQARTAMLSVWRLMQPFRQSSGA